MEDNERMRLKTALRALVVACTLVAAAGCRQEAGNTNAGGAASVKPTPSKKDAAALPENGFKAQISVADPPAKLRAGQKATLQVKVKNVSDAQWYARGGEVNTFPDNRFYIAAGDRWLKSDGQTLVTNMDGRYGLQRARKKTCRSRSPRPKSRATTSSKLT
ncbi:MAG: hypothetical protein DMF66_09850 [Acidobacteria bacterium]|nr:MAG: hypothetical protein DMF66_09850 [Acidobacteriota bacterium]